MFIRCKENYQTGVLIVNAAPKLFRGGQETKWRRGSESNRRTRLCRPLHDHSATPPVDLNVKRLVRRASRSRIWSGRRVSNSRPQPWQGCALPTELLPRKALNYTLTIRFPATARICV